MATSGGDPSTNRDVMTQFMEAPSVDHKDGTGVSHTAERIDDKILSKLYAYACFSCAAYSSAANTKSMYERLEVLLARYSSTSSKKVLTRDILFEQKEHLVRAALLQNAPGKAELVISYGGPRDLEKPTLRNPTNAPLSDLSHWPDKSRVQDNPPIVHFSMLRAFNKLIEDQKWKPEQLSALVGQLEEQHKVAVTRVTCIGHGTGGAVATIAALWCKRVAFDKVPVSCITFGAPRVGDAGFAALFNAAIDTPYRVVHKTDPLCMVPDPAVFEHVGVPVFLCEPSKEGFGLPGEYTSKAAPGYQALLRVPPPKLTKYETTDHEALNYLAAISAASSVPTLSSEELGKWKKVLDRYPESKVTQALVDELQSIDAAGQVVKAKDSDMAQCHRYAAWAWAAYEHTVNPAATVVDKKPLPGVKGVLNMVDKQLVGQILDGPYIMSARKGSGLGLLGIVKTDTQAVVALLKTAGGGGELVVAFRGTEAGSEDGSVSRSDWATDFDIRMVSPTELYKVDVPASANWRIHKGFTLGVNDIVAPMRAGDNTKTTTADNDGFLNARLINEKVNCDTLTALAQLMTAKAGVKITRVTCCGHSLGGALASLGAYWCKKVGFPDVPVACYTYGSPRVANKSFAEEWNKTIKESFRCVHKSDAVPWAPFDLFLIDTDFLHLDKSLFLCQPNEEPYCAMSFPPVTYPYAKGEDGYQGQLRRRPTLMPCKYPLNSTDHSMELYLKALANAIGPAHTLPKPWNSI